MLNLIVVALASDCILDLLVDVHEIPFLSGEGSTMVSTTGSSRVFTFSFAELE